MARISAELSIKFNTLTIFRNLTADPILKELRDLLVLVDNSEDIHEVVSAYSNFVGSLYEAGGNLTEHVRSLVVNDENIYAKMIAANQPISENMQSCLDNEIAFLQKLSQLDSKSVKLDIHYHGFLPSWETNECDLAEEYALRLKEMPQKGYGKLSKYRSFILKDKELVPVKYPDLQTLDEMYGYERECEIVIKNTLALIEGKGSNNVLLYGDAGTGKSSCVKAMINEYCNRGLRLIEVKKNQLFQLPEIIEELSSNPLKFIIFIDDLSFAENDDNFSALKAILEGSIATTGDNIAIYATSNRRHLVRENMSDRGGDDLHINDTLQEMMSLSARFGITVTFQAPDRDKYLQIVDHLAETNGIDMPKEQLHAKAETYALRRNGRSPRAAHNFIEIIKSGL